VNTLEGEDDKEGKIEAIRIYYNLNYQKYAFNSKTMKHETYINLSIFYKSIHFY